MNNKKPYIFLLVSVLIFTASFYYSKAQPARLTASQIVAVTNMARSRAGLPPLSVNNKLQSAAGEKSEDMGEKLYFSHENPDGLTPWYWFEKNRYSFLYAGENLAINFTDTDKLLAAWLKSPEHKENILNPTYRDIGVDVKTLTVGGKTYTLVVQLFGTPNTLSMR